LLLFGQQLNSLTVKKVKLLVQLLTYIVGLAAD